jgi:riboflavin kinase
LRILLKARYIKGFDKARYFMRLEPYKDIFRRYLGKDPFEGTFNIKVQNISYKDLVNKCKNTMMIPDFHYNGRILGGLYIWRGEMKDLGEILVIRPFRSSHEEDVLEIVSDKFISKSLDVKPGDLIELYIDC